MKLKKYIFVILALFLILNANLNALAMSTGFSLSEMDLEVQERFLSNVDIEPLDNPVNGYGIVCFDVNDKEIVLGFNTGRRKSVCVYNLTGDFQYGYSFNSSGKFGVEWDEENLIIYFVRSAVACSFDKNAVCTDVKIIDDTFENNSYWNNEIYSKHRKVGSCKYIIKNDMGPLNITATSYSQLIKIDEDGIESILYDANAECLAQTIFGLIFGVLFVAIVLTVVILNLIKSQKKNRI